MEIFYIAILTLIASSIGTLTGFGTSMVMIPVLAIFLPPVETIFLVAIIHWFGDLWKVALFRKGIDYKLIAWFGIIGLLFSYLGASITLGVDQPILLRVLGLFIFIYSLFLLTQSKFSAQGGPASGWKVPASKTSALVGGAASGFFAGMFGMGGALRVSFLSAFDLPKAVFLATVGAIGLAVDSTRIITYFFGGQTLPERLWLGLLIFIPVSYIGAQFAKKIVDKIPQDKFRLVVAIFLLLIGAKLAIFT